MSSIPFLSAPSGGTASRSAWGSCSCRYSLAVGQNPGGCLRHRRDFFASNASAVAARGTWRSTNTVRGQLRGGAASLGVAPAVADHEARGEIDVPVARAIEQQGRARACDSRSHRRRRESSCRCRRSAAALRRCAWIASTSARLLRAARDSSGWFVTTSSTKPACLSAAWPRRRHTRCRISKALRRAPADATACRRARPTRCQTRRRDRRNTARTVTWPSTSHLVWTCFKLGCDTSRCQISGLERLGVRRDVSPR